MKDKLEQRKSPTHVLQFYLQKCLSCFTNADIQQSKRMICIMRMLITVDTLAIKEPVYHTRL